MKAVGRLKRVSDAWGDRVRGTYAYRFRDGEGGRTLRAGLAGLRLAMPREDRGGAPAAAARCLEHTFDLLGSGWVRVEEGMACPGMEGHAYRARRRRPDTGSGRNARESRRILGLIEAPYRRLDWQIDFKSGYRWSEATWFKGIRIGPAPGADIKVPWELGRMQHLFPLVDAHIRSGSDAGGTGRPSPYLAEYRNQVLDFIGNNPPRFGVHWNCAMEVAIRVCNLLVSADLLLSAGAVLDEAFLGILANSVFEHGRHIRGNLERYGEERNNHYLADLVGLAFAGKYLAGDREAEEWLGFAAKTLPEEIDYQFNGDGSNFEGSTAYHCFSTEMALYGLALLAGEEGRKGDAYRGRYAAQAARLGRAAEFIVHITKPNGEIPQIGDDDSGSFLRLAPDEGDPLDKRSVVAAAAGLIERRDFLDFAGEGRTESLIARALAGKAFTVPARPVSAPAGNTDGEASFLGFFESESRGAGMEWEILLPSGCDQDALAIHAYPDFGLYVYEGGGFYLAVRCGPETRKGSGGHFHNDQLGVEAFSGGVALITDPGSYVYTALPARRNLYRSTRSHFVPYLPYGDEQEPLTDGLFRLRGTLRPVCLYSGPKGFLGAFHWRNREVRRGIRLEAGMIRIRDRISGMGQIPEGAAEAIRKGLPLARNYGMISATVRSVDPRYVNFSSERSHERIANR
jgi:hypothetical protein